MSTDQATRASLLDPRDDARLKALDVHAIAASAREWQQLGITARAVALYRTVLERDPHHVEALAAVAAGTATQDIDTADALYRRADAIGGLSPDDYFRWYSALSQATPRRARQAADVARRVRDRFPDRPDVGAQAALWLAALGDLTSAEVAVERLADREDLGDRTSSQLVRVIGLLLGAGGPWAAGYRDHARERIRRLASAGEPLTLLEAGRVAFQQSAFFDAREHLKRMQDRQDVDRDVASDAQLLLALIAAQVEEFDEAVQWLESCLAWTIVSG